MIGGLIASALTVIPTGVGGGPFECRVCLGLLLQHGLGRPNDREPLLPARQFGGQFISSPVRAIRRIILRIYRLGLLEQCLDFSLQPRFFSDHPAVAHGLMLRRVRLHFGAIQHDMPQLDQARSLTQPKDLHK